jgi:hypothetical protein
VDIETTDLITVVFFVDCCQRSEVYYSWLQRLKSFFRNKKFSSFQQKLSIRASPVALIVAALQCHQPLKTRPPSRVRHFCFHGT